MRLTHQNLSALFLLCGTMAVGALSAATVPPVKFTLPPRDFAVPVPAVFVVVGDFNNDGIPDVVTIDDSNYATILLGSGMGSLRAPRQIPLIAGSQAAVAGDVNGDGNLDLIYTDTFGISVLLGNGDGTFHEGGNFGATECCGFLAIGDFNGDGKLDVVALHYLTEADVFLGNGDGTFQKPMTIVTPEEEQLFGIVAADVNEDGNLDFIINAGSGINTSTILTYLGNGDGTFKPPLSDVLSYNTLALVPGDFNGDGKADLAVSLDQCCLSFVGVLLGNGDGTYRAPIVESVSTAPVFLASGDFNQDGKLDVVGGATSSGIATVFLGNGDGSLEPPSLLAVGGSGPVAVGQFNADTHLDIISANETCVSLLLGKGDGTFYEFGRYSPGPGLYSRAVALGDVNGDGRPDIVTANVLGTASVLLGNGDGTFQTAVTSPSQYSPEAIALGDFNGDGKLDAATVGGGAHGSVNVLLGNGNGTFMPPSVIIAGSYPLDIVTADVNGDGKLDLLLANSADSTVTVLLGKGDGTFQSPVPYKTGVNPVALAVGDLNGDGKLDIVTAEEQGNTVSILFGNGDGTFQAPLHESLSNQPSAVAVADMNGDSRPDIVVLTGSYVTVLINNGLGGFGTPHSYSGGSGLRSIAVGDFNADGILDVAAVGIENDAAILLGSGDGTLIEPRAYYGTQVYPLFGVATGDVNGDGKLDVVVGTQGSVDVLLNDTP